MDQQRKQLPGGHGEGPEQAGRQASKHLAYRCHCRGLRASHTGHWARVHKTTVDPSCWRTCLWVWGPGCPCPCSAPCRHHPGKLTPRCWADESRVSSHLLWPPRSLGPAPAASWLPTGFADSAFGDSVEPAWPTTDPGTADKPGLLTSPPTPGGRAAGGNTGLGCRALGIITVLLQFRAVVSNKSQHV